LNVFKAEKEGEPNSLYDQINHCRTSFGSRLLKQWLAMPLIRAEDIVERQNAVKLMCENRTIIHRLIAFLATSPPDLERGVTRILCKQCRPSEFFKIISAFKTVADILNDPSKVTRLHRDFQPDRSAKRHRSLACLNQ
jgi:DNA mismatch repair ATPase MutS